MADSGTYKAEEVFGPRGRGGANDGLVVKHDGTDEIVEIYRDFSKKIFGYCVARLYLKDFAEEATSTVFTRLVERYDELRNKSRREIGNWLYGTASNVIRRYLHDAKRRADIGAQLARQRQDRDEAQLRSYERFDWPVLYRAIATLNQQQQDIIVMRFFQELETSVIAEMLGIKHVTVRVDLSRAVKKLRKELEKTRGRLS
jgi:RNA polymerase sigma-70 factor (ECF subfamily)